jgi:hypothetical protein
MPAAHQAVRIIRRGRVKRPGRGGPPVNKLEVVVFIAQADSPDIQRVVSRVIGPAKTQATLGRVKLRQPALVLHHRHVALESCLVSAARGHAALNLAKCLLAAVTRVIKQAVEHRYICLLIRGRYGTFVFRIVSRFSLTNSHAFWYTLFGSVM